MPIDWVTVCAQIINFVILVFLLRRFLYGPIQRAVAARRLKIEGNLREAAERDAHAHEREAALDERQAGFDAELRRLDEEARAKAESDRQSLLAAARREVDVRRAEWLESFGHQRDLVSSDLSRATAAAACEIARRALMDLGDVALEGQVLAAFLRRLGSLTGQDRSDFAAAAHASGGRIQVHTSFALSAEQRAALDGALQELAGGGAHVVYERSEGRLVGVSVEAAGRRIAWSLDQYLGDIEARLMDQADADVVRLAAAHDDDRAAAPKIPGGKGGA